MPEYLSPGVYVEEVDAGPKPIEGVSTSVTGAVGVTAMGPTDGKPLLVTSFADFTRTFGGFLPDPPSDIYNSWALNDTEGGIWWHFPLSVKGYFDNGGQQLYVKRVVSSKAAASNVTIAQGFVSAIVADAAKGSNTIKLDHLIEVFDTAAIHVFRGDGTEIGAGFKITDYNTTTSVVTLDANLPESAVAKRNDYLAIQPIQAANVSLKFSAKASGKWGDDLYVRVRPMVASTRSLLYDATNAANVNPPITTKVKSVTANAGPVTTTVNVDDATKFADKDHVLINGNELVISNTTATAPGKFDVPGTFNWAAGVVVKKLRTANTPAASDTFAVGNASALYKGATVELDNGQSKELFSVLSTSGDSVKLSGKPANQYYEGHFLRVIEAVVDVKYEPDGVVMGSETFPNLRLLDDGSIEYIVNFINQESQYVTVTAPGLSANPLLDFTKFPVAKSGGWASFTGSGSDALDKLTVDDFVGVDGGSGHRTGIQALEDITDISICIVPGIWSTTVQSALITHCESLKYRFAILDPISNPTKPPSIQDIQAFREPLDTKYAALYYPWIEVRDPSAGMDVHVAPSGHIAGIYARVDVQRGVHKAPANEVILSISKISQDVTKREQDLLNPKNINALRYFPGRGNRVWGARVVTSDSSWKYVNVRRLFIFVEASIDNGTQWVVFEPNDEPLWARVRQTISNFLTTVWRSGALQGSKPDEAFFVKCDHTTMTQDDIDNGRLICVIGIAPVKPAEFVIFRIQQKTLDSTSN